MHIHYLLTDLNSGGAALPVPELVALMQAQGHSVRVLALLPKNRQACARLDQAGIGWELLGRGPLDLIPAARALLRVLREDPPDLIWTSLTRATTYGSLAGLLRGIPVVSWQHNAWLKRGNWLQLRLARSLTALWIADSHAVAEFAKRSLGIATSRIEIWPLIQARGGVPQASVCTEDVRFRVGSLGRLHRDKNYRHLIAAAARIRDLDPALAGRMEFLIGGGDGGEQRRLQAQIAKAGLDNVKLLGFVEDPLAFLASLNAYAQPSDHEGFCIAAHEAMQAGLPVVATRVGELQHSIVPDQTGMLIEVGDVEALAQSLLSLARDPVHAAALGSAGRLRVLERFGENEFQRAGKRILARVEALVAAHRKAGR